MINFNKMTGLSQSTIQAIKKAMPSAAQAKQAAPAQAKKLSESLDGLAAMNRGLAAKEGKAELLELAKTRKYLNYGSIHTKNLDNKTLKQINEEAKKISKMSFDELKEYGCSPTDLPQVSAAKKILTDPYGVHEKPVLTKAMKKFLKQERAAQKAAANKSAEQVLAQTKTSKALMSQNPEKVAAEVNTAKTPGAKTFSFPKDPTAAPTIPPTAAPKGYDVLEPRLEPSSH